eukprot:c25292_g2_i6 orf=116-1222(+)
METGVQGGRSSPHHDIIIPGLPNEVVLMILARLPRALHGSLRRVCSAWRNALQPLAMSSLRNTLHISETWILFNFFDSTVVLYDPLLQRLSSPTTYFLEGANHGAQLVGAVGSQVLFLHQQRRYPYDYSNDIRCFDASSMQWRANLIPLNMRGAFKAVVVDGHLCAVGFGEDHREVGRFDLKSSTWEMLPKMHVGRYRPLAVALQGRLHVIGGCYDERSSMVQSGEIWDPITCEWMLEPELWPPQQRAWTPVVAVVMDTLYALSDNRLELFCYVSESKLWTTLGRPPLEGRECGCGKLLPSELVGVGRELWVVLCCQYGLPGCTFIAEILSCVPTTGPSPLLWRSVPINFTRKLPGLYLLSTHGNIYV